MKHVPSEMLEKKTRIPLKRNVMALDAVCKGNGYRVLTSKEQVHRAIFGCQGKLKETSPIVNAPSSWGLGVDCLGTRCRVQGQSVSSPHEQGASPTCNLRVLRQAQRNKSHPLFVPLRMPCPYGFGYTLILMRRQWLHAKRCMPGSPWLFASRYAILSFEVQLVGGVGA